MGGMRFTLRLVLLGVALSCPFPAPGQEVRSSSDTTPRHIGHFHVGLTYHDYGLSIGNAPRVNGLRLNFQDAGLEQVNGVNITIWEPKKPLHGTVNGFALGGIPSGADLNGISIGVAGVVARHRARWINIGGFGVVSDGTIDGIALAGFGVVADGHLHGLTVAGLGAVTDRYDYDAFGNIV